MKSLKLEDGRKHKNKLDFLMCPKGFRDFETGFDKTLTPGQLTGGQCFVEAPLRLDPRSRDPQFARVSYITPRGILVPFILEIPPKVTNIRRKINQN